MKPILNETRHNIIAKVCRELKDPFSQSIGLMFSRRNPSLGLIFSFQKEKKIPIHMFFVFYPIDLLYLDNNMMVIEIKKNLKPFAFYNPRKKAKYLIEIVAGKSSGIKLNDRISFK